LTEQEQIDYLQQIAESAKEGTQANAMEQLALLAQQQLLWEERVEMLEEKLKTAKKQVENISGNLIPNLLASSGLSEVRLGTGEKITVKKGLSVSYDKVADQNKLFAFLKKENAADLIKTTFSIPQVPDGTLDKIFDFMDSTVVTYETKMDVHAKTLEKFIRELTAVDKPDEERQRLYEQGRIKNIEELPEFLKVYTFSKTKIEK
jgi:hypothetical protein